MSSFNVESTFLDLKKTYQHFEYVDLVGQGFVGTHQTSEAYEGMTQNTYLLVQEKTVLAKDVENMALYFMIKYCGRTNGNEAAFNAFPFEKVRDRVCFIFQKYQEQPTLLDTLLEVLVQPLMNAVRDYLQNLLRSGETACEQFHWLLEVVYQLTKVRGDKCVIQYFPHEVRDLYPALGYLVRECKDSTNKWESRYVILLWLGVIALVPFDLEIIDSGVLHIATPQKEVTQIVELMIQVGKMYLKSLTKMREASAIFLGKLFTRPDIQKRGVLAIYVQDVLSQLSEMGNNPLDNFFVCGLYDSLCSIFRQVQRKQLLPLISPVLAQLHRQELKLSNGSKKELMVRLLTSLGLTYLQPRIVTWAYRKKKQSLRANLANSKAVKIQTNTNRQVETTNRNEQKGNQETVSNEAEYYGDVDKQNLEDIIGMLIDALSEKETTVREEASKGLGIIAGRLSQDMVLDIVDHIIQLHPTPQTQHALCLTFAELIRRNLLSPQKLQEFYPIIGESLLYQREEGGYSVGQAVRDAACYMTWSVARGYEQGGRELGVNLMVAACFDREVGCRRAASAAYQQLVGRVGDVPHGIEILTEADYFTLGLQKNAYLNVAVFVASYDEYYKPFAEHLCYQKLRHWDLQIKRIAACSLSLMSPLNPQFMAHELIPALGRSLDVDSNSYKLGALIGIGEVFLGLKGLSHSHQLHDEMKDSVFLKSLTQNEKKLMKAGEYMEAFKNSYDKQRLIDHFDLIDTVVLNQIVANLIAKIIDKRLYKGKAGENFRIYTCRLLECLAICNVPLSSKDAQIFRDFIEENIRHPQEPILFAAVRSLKPFLSRYFLIEQDDKFLKNMMAQANSGQPQSRCYTLALSRLSQQMYVHHFEDLLTLFETNCKITKENNDPEKRKYALMAIEILVIQVGFQNSILQPHHLSRIFDILYRTIEDYTMDKRGDIGSIVREQTMTTMIKIIEAFALAPARTVEITSMAASKIVALFLQQLCEKIDRIRLLAGSLLQKFFDDFVHLFEIPHQKELYAIFSQENIRKLIKESERRIDSNLDTEVINMEMKIQETIFHSTERYLIYFWNLPHSVFPLTVPLLNLDYYRPYILKGLCTSTGGISQSTIKHSLHELGNYVTHLFSIEANPCLMSLFQQIMRLLVVWAKDERIIVPLYKTLDFLLERNQMMKWEGLKTIDTELFNIIEAEMAKTKRISKVSASIGLYVSLLTLNNPATKPAILKSIVKNLCSDLPKARKILADKLLLFLMSQEEYVIFSEGQTQQLMNVLAENDFLEEKLDVEVIKEQLTLILARND